MILNATGAFPQDSSNKNKYMPYHISDFATLEYGTLRPGGEPK